MPAHLADRGADMGETVAASDQRAKVRLRRRKHLDPTNARQQGVVLAEAHHWEEEDSRRVGVPHRDGEVAAAGRVTVYV